MVIFKLRLLLMVGFVFFFGVCVQFFVFLIVVVDELYLMDEVWNEIVVDVYEKIE